MELLLIRHASTRSTRTGDRCRRSRALRGRSRPGAAPRRVPRSERLDAVYASPLRRATRRPSRSAASQGARSWSSTSVAEWDRTLQRVRARSRSSRRRTTRAGRRCSTGEWNEHDESPQEFHARVVAAVERAHRRPPGQRIAIVCHGGVINGYLSHILGLNEARTVPAGLLLPQLHLDPPGRRRPQRRAVDRDRSTRPRTCAAPASRWACSRSALTDTPWHATPSTTSSPTSTRHRRRGTPSARPPTALLDGRVRAARRGRRRGASVPDAGFVVRGGAVVAWRARRDRRASAGRRRSASSARTPTRRACGSSHGPTPAGSVGSSSRVEVYGGVLLNSWLDRDLGVAGRVVLQRRLGRRRRPSTSRSPRPAARDPPRPRGERQGRAARQAAAPHAGVGHRRAASGRVPRVARRAARRRRRPTSAWWELCLFDRTPAAVLGADSSLLASGRLDNQLVVLGGHRRARRHAPRGRHHIGDRAVRPRGGRLARAPPVPAGPLLEHVLERIVARPRRHASTHLHRPSPRSSCVSADNAHAVHPNYPERHEPGHRPIVNQGPAIKVNAQPALRHQRRRPPPSFQRACERAGVPWQVFVRRNNMPCGSTIGPITATAARHRHRRRRRAAAVDALGPRAVRRRRPAPPGRPRRPAGSPAA